MRHLFPKMTPAVVILALLSTLSVTALTQDKPEDPKKILTEIAGASDFNYQGQTLTVVFSEENGKLFGAPVGETPEEIKPVEGKPLCFDVTVAASGQYYELKFVRNEQGVIEKCILTTMGMEIGGIKAVK